MYLLLLCYLLRITTVSVGDILSAHPPKYLYCEKSDIVIVSPSHRPSCTQMAAEVCHKVWVVMHDPQGASEDAQGGPSSRLPLGLGGMASVVRASFIGCQSAWRYFGGCHDGGLSHELVDQIVTV